MANTEKVAAVPQGTGVIYSPMLFYSSSRCSFKLKRNKQETWYLLDDHISLYYSAINPVNIMHYLLLIISKYFYISKYFLFSRCRRCATTLHRTKNGWDSVRFPNAAGLPSSVTFSCKRRVLRTSYRALSRTTAQLYCAYSSICSFSACVSSSNSSACSSASYIHCNNVCTFLKFAFYSPKQAKKPIYNIV